MITSAILKPQAGIHANGQFGATNSQTIGQTKTTQQSVTKSSVGTVHQSKDQNAVSAQKVQSVTVNQSPAWVLKLSLIQAAFFGFLIGLFLRSPQDHLRSLFSWWKARKK